MKFSSLHLLVLLPLFVFLEHPVQAAAPLTKVVMTSGSASERDGVVEPQAEQLLFGVLCGKDRLLDFLTAGSGKHIEVFDSGRGQRDKSIEFVDVSNDVNHVLTGQGVFGEKVPEPT